MAEIKTTYENTGLPPQILTLTSGTELVRQISIDDAESVDVILTIIVHTKN